jgi:hypothetical protein
MQHVAFTWPPELPPRTLCVSIHDDATEFKSKFPVALLAGLESCATRSLKDDSDPSAYCHGDIADSATSHFNQRTTDMQLAKQTDAFPFKMEIVSYRITEKNNPPGYVSLEARDGQVLRLEVDSVLDRILRRLVPITRRDEMRRS